MYKQSYSCWKDTYGPTTHTCDTTSYVELTKPEYMRLLESLHERSELLYGFDII